VDKKEQRSQTVGGAGQADSDSETASKPDLGEDDNDEAEVIEHLDDEALKEKANG